MSKLKATFCKSCYLEDQLFKTNKKEIVFVGRSNVGKSSLINKIFNRKNLARVSNVPGKTDSINFYLAGDVFFVDFPGYGFSKISKSKRKIWDSLAEAYFSSKRRVILAFLVLDARRGCGELDYEMVKYLVSKRIYFVVVITKIDKLKNSEVGEIFNKTVRDFSFIKNVEIMLLSSKTGQGIENFRQFIVKFCENVGDV